MVEAAVEAQHILSDTSIHHTLSDAIRAHQGLLSKSFLHRLQTLSRSDCAVRHTTPAASRALLSEMRDTMYMLGACSSSSPCSSTDEVAVVADSVLPAPHTEMLVSAAEAPVAAAELLDAAAMLPVAATSVTAAPLPFASAELPFAFSLPMLFVKLLNDDDYKIGPVIGCSEGAALAPRSVRFDLSACSLHVSSADADLPASVHDGTDFEAWDDPF